MPGVGVMSQESWKQVRFDVMTGKRRKKPRHKMPTISKLCSCMAGQTDDFPESSRPFSRKYLEPAETSQNVEPVAAAGGAVKAGLEVTSEEPEPAQDIEIPPPMAIQDRSFKTSAEAPAAPVDEAVAKLATMNLKGQSDTGASALDLANELESIVKRQIEPNSEALKSESSAEDDACGEDGEKQDGADSGEKDVEAERAKYLKKRQFVIQELYDTELAYVEDLKNVVDGYMGYMKENPLPEDMEGKDKIVFGNIHQILDWHAETMVKELEACLTAPNKVGSIFVRYERRLYMYVKYCENKPKSEYIVSEFLDTFFEEIRQKLGHRLTLPDLLIKPVQRIMRYQLLLRDILKYTEKAAEDSSQLKKALRVMCIVPKAANDMMQVGRLQGFDGKITAQGKLLLQDTLQVSEVTAGMPQKPKERRLFLFEQIIIFSEMIERKKGDFSNASYVYKNSLKVNKMSMTSQVEGEPLKFILIDRTPGSDTKYVLQAPSEEVKDTWIKEIRSILDMQGDFLRALQSPIAYQKEQKELTKELSAPEFGSLPRDSALRKTQSHPVGGTGEGSSPLSADVRNKGRKDSNKHERCTSVPNPLSEVAGENDSDSNSNSKKPSCPNSPTDTSKDATATSKPCSTGEGSWESPKPRKTNLLRSLQRKSRNEGGSSGGRAQEPTYANTHPVAEGAPESNGGRTPNADSPSARPPLSQAADSDQVPAGAGAASGGESTLSAGRVLCDYMAVREDEITVHKGETVQVLSTTPHGMFLVHRPANESSPAAEGWLPAHVIGPKDIDGSLKKTWQMFKLKKPNFRGRDEGANSLERRSKSLGRDQKPRKIAADPGCEVPPIVQQPLTSLTVQAGDTATFTCRICGRPRPTLSWRYQDATPVTPSPLVMMLYNEEGVATLQLSQVSLADSGEYACVASSELGTVVTRATLTVLDRPGPPGQPSIRNQVGTAVHLEWCPPPQLQSGQIQGYTIEFREAGSDLWHLAIPYVPNTSQVIGDLEPGLTYQFRVSANNAIGISEPSQPSTYIAIPSEFELSEREDAPCVMWKTTYDNDFTDGGEIGKGRFAVVRRCIQRCSGQELAAKLIPRRLVRREAVEIEFNTLQSLQHPHLVQVYDLYETANAHILIMQLIPNGRLFDYICSRQHFDELMAAEFVRQLLDVMQFLHNCRIAHLDVKPENILVELGAGTTSVKLVDFSDARHIYNNYYIHPVVGNPEFMSPEVISGTPVGLLTDIWNLGIVIYVLLSGVSPFLDESQEETCSNIVRNDFCFPEEYFAGISSDAKDLVRSMLVEDVSKRPTAQQCADCPWIKKACAPRSSALRPKPINTARLADFVERRKHQSDSYLLKTLP